MVYGLCQTDRQLEAISKIYLTPNYGVADLLKMLTYSHVCCAFSSARALSLNVICIFEIASGVLARNNFK
jgi:hypothetical protein